MATIAAGIRRASPNSATESLKNQRRSTTCSCRGTKRCAAGRSTVTTTALRSPTTCELPGFRAFVYLPDHAEAVDAGLMHDPQRFTFAMTHISLLVWLSDAFMTSEPDRAKALHQHENSVWTNDLLDDLLVGLTGIDAKNHDTSYDLSSNGYRLDWNSALTFHGAKKVKDDPQ